jgi:hypothetical protein
MGYANATTDTSAIQSGRANGTVDELALNPYGGNIGIGTSSPLAKLQVTATGSVNPAFFYGSDTWNYPVRIRNTTSGQEQNLDLKQGTGGASILTTGTSLTFQTESTERARFTSTGLGIGTTSPSEKLDVDGDSIRLRQSQTPASATATGSQGQIAWDSNYMYVCVATNTWKRVALSTW